MACEVVEEELFGHAVALAEVLESCTPVELTADADRKLSYLREITLQVRQTDLS